MLGYKTTWTGGTLIVAGRFYPSSKTCVRHEARCCIARRAGRDRRRCLWT
jgi:transposase